MFIWWRLYLLITMIFIYMIKYDGLESTRYFVVQEIIGFLFIILVFDVLQSLFLILKIGFSPFHFWIFMVIDGCKGFLFLWFLTIQKMPYIFSILYVYRNIIYFLVLFGILVCVVQVYFMSNRKYLYFVNSTDSARWIFLGILMFFFEFFVVYFFYVMSLVFILFYFNYLNFDLNWELALFVMNIPLSINFFIKIFVLISFSMFNVIFIMLLVLIFLRILGYTYLLFNNSMKFLNYGNNSLLLIFYFVFSVYFLF